MKKAQWDKTRAETAKMRKETFWHPVLTAAGLMGTGAAAVIVATKLLR